MISPLHHRPEIHGHRGCRGLRPENTIPAFLHALALGVDVLELDVVISADKQVVVSHEPWLNPLFCLNPLGQPIATGTPPQQHNLYQMPYATIRQCDCGQPHPGFPEQVATPSHKPLLREVLAAVESATSRLGRPPVGYSIEIKSSPELDNIFSPPPSEFLPLVLAELSSMAVLPRTTLLCFDARILQLAHHSLPSLATCLLVEAHQPWVEGIQQLGFVPTTLGPDSHAVSAAAVTALRATFPGLRLVPWTVNTPVDMDCLIRLEVDGITTDYPNRLLSLLGYPL
ncbi:glycerophosphodiester phosphodiesterase [Hymenobacter sp. 5317J-9]|uniref:glycerophosphodiester phosphodiesterase family protein n=1 Tax=Hymenobacter sp. 5317J-9 TaxID=2932250 RepID=UPI001FD66BD6|nr:glycerophosphodiester phosphodiesterase family protein [Hymenobacter sp. 5317J-9]UOQ98087.1 glycerophosphodiester phosphodiesterase [Hymenobacter sp. 5317J-9]